MAEGPRPLAGICVLDLARAFPGGYCSLLLADLGANVVKVEQPVTGDPLRRSAGDGDSPAHIGLNRGKRSMTLDLRSEAGIDVLRRLVSDADVLIESARPGSMEAAGFGYPQAAEVNSRLVWASITGFGSEGPYAKRPGHEVTFLGHSGLLAALPEALPFMPEAMLSVPIGGLMAAFAIASAVVGAQRTGFGCFVDAAISDASTWLLSGMPNRFSAPAAGMGSTAGRRLYRCADGKWVTVAAAEPRTWRALCERLDAPDLVDAFGAGPDEQAVIERRFEAAFSTKSAADWVAISGDATIGAVHEGADLAENPQGAARGVLVEVAGMTVPATPVRFSAAGGPASTTPTAGPPALGQDTDAVLADAGFGPAEIDALRSAGTV